MGQPTRSRGERGSQLVEFGLLLPVLVFTLLLALDGGRLVATYIALKNGTTEAAKYAAAVSTATTDDLKTIAAQEGRFGGSSSPFLAPGSFTNVTISTRAGQYQNYKDIRMDYRFDFITRVLGLGTSITVTSQATWAMP